MLRKLRISFIHFWQTAVKGYGACSKCDCGAYSAGNDPSDNYCGCGHSFGDHW